MKVDLHVHTNISDSSFDLESTIALAKLNGVTHLGITNHDTVEELEEAMEVGKKSGVKIIPGIEISAWDSNTGKKVHILGFNFDFEAANIKKICTPILEKRNKNSLENIEKLINYGYQLNRENIYVRAEKSKVIYKQHIMAELIDKGYTDSIYSDLYKELFKGNGLCASNMEYVDVIEAVKAIKADGGIAILAHPGQLDSYYLIDKLVEAGLDGIEKYHEVHSEEDHRKVDEYCKRYNLITTGGSDFHGTYGTSTAIGEITTPREFLYVFDNEISKNCGESEEEFLAFIEEIAHEAGVILKDAVSQNISVNFKEGCLRDIVTLFDVQIENFLVERINKRYPGHSFITEEKTISNQCFSQYTWIIDPIDGTTNFVNTKKDFAISIALYKYNKPFIGVVYDVINERIYSAINGRGAFINGLQKNKNYNNFTLKDSIIDFSLNTIEILREKSGVDLVKLNQEIRGHRSYGAASIAICKIALGELQGYISAKLSLWDYAAAIVFLKELGGDYIYFNNASGFEDNFSLGEITKEKVTFIAAENKNIKNEITNFMI